MKVFKFGGASVCDVEAIQNLKNIVQHHAEPPLIIVLSAMGKSTNLLEHILDLKLNQQDYHPALNQFRSFHRSICEGLFNQKDQAVMDMLDHLVSELERNLQQMEANHAKMYDRVVCYGELVSTSIVHRFLEANGIKCKHLDARELIKTDSTYQDGNVRWNLTTEATAENISLSTEYYITQGFIASDEYGNPVTLGREGSDFSASIFAYCLDAESVTIWKDVPGVLNADPDLWKETEKYDVLSYAEAAEMTYYGASVIHPKTIRPLAEKNIQLYVKSFFNPEASGTVIKNAQHEELEPAIIFKKEQCLISFQARDLSFINESKVSMIFHLFEQFNIQVNLIQNSAISFSASVDSPDTALKNIINSLSGEFEILYNDHLELITIKNYRPSLIPQVIKDRLVLLEQKTRKNYQALVKMNSSNQT